MEMILHNSWKTLCDLEWKAGENSPPTNSVVFVHTDQLFDFLRLISGRPEQYILVSADSDYGIEYQDKDTVSKDIFKWMRFIDSNFVKGYDPLVILPRCNVNTCKITDQFCKKMYSFTKDTINELLPSNIKFWFGTNINVASPKLCRIPFGISPESAKYLKWTHFDTKEDKIYCNFQLNTIERYELISALKYFDRCVIEQNVSHEKYCESLRKYKYTLSCEGNGRDSYRSLESIYSGSIPIINDDLWSEAYTDLPVVKIEANNLNQILGVSFKGQINIVNEKSDLNYWRQLIKAKKEELCV